MTEPVPSWRPRPPLSRLAVARLVQLGGLFDVLTTLLPPHHGAIAELAGIVPVAGMLTARAATAAAGVLLVYLGAGLRRGKHRAWQVAVAVAATGVVLHVAKGLDLDAATVSAALLAMLVAVRRDFRSQADRRNRWRALTAFVGFAGVGFLLGLIEIAVRQNHLLGTPGVRAWAEQAALGLVGMDGPVEFVRPVGAAAVSYTTGTFGLLAFGAAVVLLLRPGSRIPQQTTTDEQHLRDLLHRYGDADSLGYFALRRDKSLMWAPNRAAAVAYRVINGVSLASGDPIGPESAWPTAIDAWLTDCTTHGWTPAVLACGNTGARAYRKAGLDVIELGDEAILDTTTFTLTGRPMRTVRQAVNRVQRAGYTCHATRQRDLDPTTLTEIVHAAEAFRDGTIERGFSMALSRLADPHDTDCLIVTARDATGTLRGVLQFVPWGTHGLSLDLMRGDRTADNGLTELMIVTAVHTAPHLNIHHISLNFAVLRSVFARADEIGAGPILRITHRTLKALSHLWQIESLYRANTKYQPTWHPRYLCFPTARDLPRIAIAVLSAEAFLPTTHRTKRTLTTGEAEARVLSPA